MRFTRAQALSVMLIASILAMTTGTVFAAPSHDVCDAMRHGCARIDALASCCCGDASDANPSRVPSNRTVAGVDTTHNVATLSLTFDLPALVVMSVHEGPPLLARPPDLRILFSDLRI